MTLTIKQNGSKYAIFAGVSCLSKKFANLDAAKRDLEKNGELYKYWAGSASVSIHNSEWVTVRV